MNVCLRNAEIDSRLSLAGEPFLAGHDCFRGSFVLRQTAQAVEPEMILAEMNRITASVSSSRFGERDYFSMRRARNR
ncbi:hypothetical protein [Paraburkholderia sp. RL17-381-BIF-C]|uniref:hypothetical protein n=1 Tax=Paraburkholderia sp. RL17-381-BIF-C TaxID=3031635 RepID=UPI0038B9CB5C